MPRNVPRPIDPVAVEAAEHQMLTPRNEKRMRTLLEALCDPARITIVRQTPAVVAVANSIQNGGPNRPVGRNGLATLPRLAAQNEAEGTVIPFKPSPLGRNGDLSS